MSRTIITAVVGAVIAVLTAIAFIVSSSSINDRAKRDAEDQLNRAYQVVQRLNQLQSIDTRNKAERLAAVKQSPTSQPEFLTAIESPADRDKSARNGFLLFTADDKQGAVKPDIIALVDKDGLLLAMYEVSVVPKQWLVEGDPNRKSIIPPLNYILTKQEKVIISDIWTSDKGMMRVGAAPVVNADGAIVGAVLVAYAQTARNAQQDRELLGMRNSIEIAYYDKKPSGEGKQVLASSFTRGDGFDEDTAKAHQLGDLLGTEVAEGMAKGKKITIDGVDYLAAAVKMPRSYTKELAGYPEITAGAVVLSRLDVGGSGAVKMLILLLGVGSLAMAMLGLYLAHRRLIAQVDQVELGVSDVINGNLDRTFRPVGPELDGLSNGLNVMLARLLGRPEPGEEEFDDEGNPIMPGRVDFEEGEERPAPDPDLAALAQESEPDYYKRVFTEYQAARKALNQPDDGSFENFIAKLKVNEGKLKAQYQCRAVRFRVVTKDGKVTLKPVPIFA
jgi:hypothetical protein